MKIKSRLMYVLSMGVCSALMLVGSVPTQAFQNSLPGGSWTVAIRPETKPGYDTVPVMLTSTTTFESGGLAVRQATIWNISSKTVTGLALRWRLTNDQNPNTVLKENRTPVFDLGAGIPDDGMWNLAFTA
jgi:hypothetical protein